MGGSDTLAAALSAFSDNAQHGRLLRLEFPLGDGPRATLLANTLHASEAISRSFRFDVELLSDDARIPLKAMMGRNVTISLVRFSGALRYFNGYVTEFRFLRADGGFAFYQMILEPWLAFARLRTDCVCFLGKTVREISEETFKHYREADWRMLSNEDDPVLTMANQHNETDYNHLHRRWEARGLHYWYEHRADGHMLVLSDNSFLAEPIDSDRHYDADVINFHDKSGSREDDGIHQWSPSRKLGSGITTLTSFDYKQACAQDGLALAANEQGDFFAHDVYENTGAYGFRTSNDGDRLAEQRTVERDKDTQTFDAEGNDRCVQPGRVFKLGNHFSAGPRPLAHHSEPRPPIGNRDYLVLTVEHEASNNYQAGPTAPSHYKNSFTCIRSAIRWRPGRNFNSQPCPNPGVQTAIVVGPVGSEIHTDNLGRVKVQFHWDRLGKRDENSSAWIRVMSPAAGAQFGQIRLPRVGEEVVVVYPDGNIDYPLIIGGVYNATHMPPWSTPDQSSLSGLRSRELGGGGRSNHLVLDDTAGKIQTQLKSDHQCSQLSLGHITRIEDHAGRKDARGEGFELRTDAWGVVRAARGLLLTTEARLNAASHVKAMKEIVRRLGDARNQHQSQAELARDHGVQQEKMQAEVADVIKGQNEAIRGSGDAFPELATPHLVLASQGGIETSTSESTHIASDGHTALTSGKSLSIVSGESLFATIGNTLRLFVYKAGMKLVAASGDIDIRALSHNLHLLAKLNMTHNANCITITAKEELVINGGGSYAKFNGNAIEFGTNGNHVFHAAQHNFEGAKNMEAELEVFDIKAAPKTTRSRQRPISA